MNIPDYITAINNLFPGNTYVVGGAVRDHIMGIEPKDYDLLVCNNSSTEVENKLKSLPGHVKLTGRSFGVYRWVYQDIEVEVALPRLDQKTGTGHGHKDFTARIDPYISIDVDLYRRDFTMNSMAYDLATGNVIDPYGGIGDIRNKIVVATSYSSFADDPLRIIRGFVAVARTGFEIKPGGTRQLMSNYAERIQHLPGERIQEELDKLFEASNPRAGIELAHEVGALQYFLPEVEDCWDYDQNNQHHTHLLHEHLLITLDNMVKLSDDKDLRLAALLHDIGKPASAWVDPVYGTNHYYYDKESGLGQNHAVVGANMADDRLNALRYPLSRAAKIHALIKHHMYAPFTTKRGARRFINRIGADLVQDLFDLRIADTTAHGTDKWQKNYNQTYKEEMLVKSVLEDDEPTNLSMLAVNGHDLIEAGMEPGPEIGRMLNEMTEYVIDYPQYNTKEKLLGRFL